MLKDLVRRAAYSCGALSLYHRLRNADSLTVVMFHRTLSPDDPRWASCDPDYTLRRDLFVRALAFFGAHYNVVSLQDVLDARRGLRRLPPRALLLTFDDGWADNADHALPELQRAGMPAVMFVVADAVGCRQPFWQERLIAAWRLGRIRLADLAAALGQDDPPPARTGTGHELATLRALIACLEALPRAKRESLLATFAESMDDGLRHMVDTDELIRLRAGGVDLGLHGKRHVRMTEAQDLDGELAGARGALSRVLGDADASRMASMSFPHGAYDIAIAKRALQAGYELLFTSVPVLNPTAGAPGWLLGRTGFETETVLDSRGRFRADWLAWYLFRREARRLA
jgi:peptidoglycan/xylan/chitin deacetylase (PgdA/CDA1 family)